MNRSCLAIASLLWMPAALMAQGGKPPARPAPFFYESAPNFKFHLFEDDAGGFYAVWTDQEAGESRLWAQRFNAQGSPVWQPSGTKVTPRLISWSDWDGLADGEGGLTLFWDEADGVYAQRFKPDGTRRLPAESGVRLSSSVVRQPSAVPDVSGGTLVAWSMVSAQGVSKVHVQRFAQSRPQWASEGIPVSQAASDQRNPKLVYDNMGGAIVVWRDERNRASGLAAQRIDGLGNRLWGPEGLRSEVPLGREEMPIVAPLGEGDAVVAWSGFQQAQKVILMQRVGPGPDIRWGRGGRRASRTNANHWNPLLASDESGGTWIAWEDFRNEMNWQLHLNHFTRDGEPAWSAGDVAVAPARGDQGLAAMASDGEGGAWIAWVDNRGAYVQLFVQRISADGRKLMMDGGFPVSPPLRSPQRPQIISLASGKAVLGWVDSPKKGDWAFYWRLLP